MRYSIRDIIFQVQQDIVANLNDFIAATQREGENWFRPLSFHDDAPHVDTDRYFMGIYLASPEGNVYEGNFQNGKTTVALDCILSDRREDSNLPQLYLSAVIDFLRKRRYGTSSTPTYAETARVDLDAPVNAFSVAIDVSVYDMDYDI